MTLTIYALKSCDSCKKAIKSLTAAGHELKIIDVRADGVPEDQLAAWLATHGGEIVVNRKSTTWRGFDEVARSAAPLDLLKAHPTLLKRPVIIADGTSHIGWGKDVQAEFGL